MFKVDPKHILDEQNMGKSCSRVPSSEFSAYRTAQNDMNLFDSIVQLLQLISFFFKHLALVFLHWMLLVIVVIRRRRWSLVTGQAAENSGSMLFSISSMSYNVHYIKSDYMFTCLCNFIHKCVCYTSYVYTLQMHYQVVEMDYLSRDFL